MQPDSLFSPCPRLTDAWHTHKKVLIPAFIVSVLAFATRIITISYCTDDYTMMFTRPDFLSHGRWFFHLIYHYCLGSQYIPVLVPILGIASMVLAGWQLALYWQIKSPLAQFCLITLFAIHPYLIDMYNFHVVTLAFPLGYLLTLTALNLIHRPCSHPLLNRLLPVLLITAALGIYQPVISVLLIALTIRYLILRLPASSSSTPASQPAPSFAQTVLLPLLLTIFALILYALITQALFALTAATPNQRLLQGLIHSIPALKQKIGWALLILASRVLPIPELILPFPLKLTLFITALLMLIVAFHYTLKRSIPRALTLLIILALAPFIAIAHTLPTAISVLPWRTSLGLSTLFLGCYALFLHCRPSRRVQQVLHILLFIIMLAFCLQDNALFFRQHLRTQQDLTLATRIAARLESLPDYRPDLTLVIVGDLDPLDFHKENKTPRQIVTDYLHYCSRRPYSIARSAFAAPWSKYHIFNHFLEMPITMPTPQDQQRAQSLAAHRDPFPSPDAVFIHDNLAVIVLAPAADSQEVQSN